MLETGDAFVGLIEGPYERWIVGGVGSDHLYCNVAACGELAGCVYPARQALSDHVAKFVATGLDAKLDGLSRHGNWRCG